MEQHHSNAAVITGSSTHNERVERLWRDVFRCVGVLSYDTFQHLQEDGKVNPLNEVDMYCLHYVFLPRINKALESFVESWNNHPVSTEHNRTPNQLFVEGALQQATSGGPPRSSGTSLPTSHDPVQVPRSSFTPCAVLKTDVDRVDVLKDSNNFGIDIYNEIVRIVGRHLTHGCSTCFVD